MADRFDWPPVFERLLGNPVVVIKERNVSALSIVFVRPGGKIFVKVSPEEPTDRIDLGIRDYFLGVVWDHYLSEEAFTGIESKFGMRELIPLDRETFFQLGRIHLSGHSTGCPEYDAWWNVRMGKELHRSSEYLLCFNTLVWAESTRIPHGHFSFAIRKRGGAPDSDLIFDFRTPWNLDRRTSAKDVFGDLMMMHSFKENFYDWLSTHAGYRNCDITSVFVPVADDQVILCQAARGKIHEDRKYGLLKGNCASLGLQFVNRLLPLDQRIPGENSLVDFPVRKIRIATKSFGEVIAVVEHKSTTLESRGVLTHKNRTRPADPDRRNCEPFQNLLKVKEIN